MSIPPNSKIRWAELNTVNLRNLAGSLFPAISDICASGATINLLNVNNLSANNLTTSSILATGGAIANLIINNIQGTSIFISGSSSVVISAPTINITGAIINIGNSTTTGAIYAGNLFINGAINGHIAQTGGLPTIGGATPYTAGI
jgi:hypothetical protein